MTDLKHFQNFPLLSEECFILGNIICLLSKKPFGKDVVLVEFISYGSAGNKFVRITVVPEPHEYHLVFELGKLSSNLDYKLGFSLMFANTKVHLYCVNIGELVDIIHITIRGLLADYKEKSQTKREE